MTFIRSHGNQGQMQKVNPFLSLVLGLAALMGPWFSHFSEVPAP